MEKITQSQIAKETNVSENMVKLVRRGESKTTNIPLAIAVAALTGKRPIDYISLKIRSMALAMNPELNKKVSKSA